MATEQHVIPADDGYDHDLEDCVCVPKIHATDDGPIYMHNALAKSGRYQIVDVIAEEETTPDAPTEETDHG